MCEPVVLIIPNKYNDETTTQKYLCENGRVFTAWELSWRAAFADKQLDHINVVPFNRNLKRTELFFRDVSHVGTVLWNGNRQPGTPNAVSETKK